MSHKQRHLKSQSITTYEEPYVISKPTTAAFISPEIMEINEEKTSVRQTSKIVCTQSKLVENQETKG